MISEKETLNMLMAIKNSGWTPDKNLSELKYVLLKSKEDFAKLPKTNCAYWIVTNEPIRHSMCSPSKYDFPKEIEGVGEIIYNGVSKNLKSRIENHLLRKKCEGQSAISVDLLISSDKPNSHVKFAFKKDFKKNTNPFLIERKSRITSYEDLFDLNISVQEKTFLKNSNNNNVYFWNGINVLWDKHVNYDWFVYYYECEDIMSSIIENQWRERFGKPKLCTYNGGR